MLALVDRAPQTLPRICHVNDIALHAAEGDGPEIGFDRLVPAGCSPMRPPLFLLGEAGRADLAALFGQIATPEIGCYRLRDATIAPTGIGVIGDTAFCSDALAQPPAHVVAIIDRLNASHLPVRHLRGPVAVIDGPGHETWGHWLTDFLPRLAVLYETGWDLAALRFVVPWDLGDRARELLLACGIAEDQLIAYDFWREVLTTDRLLLPTLPRRGDRLSPYFAQATQFWLRRLLTRLRLPANPMASRLFLSRTGMAPQRRLENRAQIEQEAKRRGLTPVRPETLPLATQIALFRQARLLVGEYGSALHNSVFGGAGVAVGALRGTSAHPGYYQSGIATSLDQQAGYVFGDTSGQDVEQAFTIDPGAFHQAMDILDTL